MSLKTLSNTILAGMMCFTLGCNNGDDNNDDTDTGDSRTTSDESFFKDKCDVDTDDDCFQLREDITVFNPDDFSDVTDFRVIHIGEDQADGQLKDGDVIIEMMLKDGAPLPEPVEVGRIIYRKKGNQITVRRIKGVQKDGNKARFLTENLELKEVFKRWRMKGRWAVDLDTETAVKLKPGEEPGDRALASLNCVDPDEAADEDSNTVIDKINNALPEGAEFDAGCELSFDLIAEINNVGGFVTEEGTSKIGVLGVATFDAWASLETDRKLTTKDGTVAKFIDLRPNDAFSNRIKVPMGPITLKLGVKFKVVATSDRANRMDTYVTARIEAGPVVKKTPKKGYSFTFFEKRVSNDPTGGDGYCDGEAVGDKVEDNPCFFFQEPILDKDGQMNVKVGIEPEILITSPSVGGLAGITVGMYTFGEFNIEGEVDRTEVDSISGGGFISGITVEQTSCWEFNAGFTPTIGVEVFGNEIVEFNVATFSKELFGGCTGPTRRTLGGDGVEWCDTVEAVGALNDVSEGEAIDEHLGPMLGDGLCMVNRHCTLLERGSRPDVACVPDQPTCDLTTCTCEEPSLDNGQMQNAPDFVGAVKIRDAWMNDTDSYCCLPQEAIRERKEGEAADPGPNDKGAAYWNSFSCNDGDFSTVDSCVAGNCQYEFLPGSCQEDSDCDANEIWVAEDDADRDHDGPHPAPGISATTQGICHTLMPFVKIDGDIIEKRFGTPNYATLSEADTALLTMDTQSPLWDDGGKLGQKNNLGVCMWDSVIDGMGVQAPSKAGLNCNVSTQKADCDDGLPFTFDYCAPDEEILTHDWGSPAEAPEKWGRCYRGIQACPTKIQPFLDSGAVEQSAFLPCCEQRTGKKMKANENWFIYTSGPGTTGEYDWSCGQVVVESTLDPEWSPGG